MLQQIEITQTMLVDAKGELIDASQVLNTDNSCCWVARQRASQQTTHRAIAWRIGLTPEEYDRFKVNVLLDYVQTLFTLWAYPDPEGLAYSTLARKEIMGWWRNEWSVHDDSFLDSNSLCKDKQGAKDFVLKYHLSRLSPDNQLGAQLKESFLKMIES